MVQRKRRGINSYFLGNRSILVVLGSSCMVPILISAALDNSCPRYAMGVRGLYIEFRVVSTLIIILMIFMGSGPAVKSLTLANG
jgi:hypothetical protein